MRGSETLKKIFEPDPPYRAHVKFELGQYAAVVERSPMSPWLAESVARAVRNAFWKKGRIHGRRRFDPLHGHAGKKVSGAQFLITGVLGRIQTPHGPNEFLHIPTGEKVTCCVAECACRSFHRK